MGAHPVLGGAPRPRFPALALRRIGPRGQPHDREQRRPRHGGGAAAGRGAPDGDDHGEGGGPDHRLVERARQRVPRVRPAHVLVRPARDRHQHARGQNPGPGSAGGPARHRVQQDDEGQQRLQTGNEEHDRRHRGDGAGHAAFTPAGHDARRGHSLEQQHQESPGAVRLVLEDGLERPHLGEDRAQHELQGGAGQEKGDEAAAIGGHARQHEHAEREERGRGRKVRAERAREAVVRRAQAQQGQPFRRHGRAVGQHPHRQRNQGQHRRRQSLDGLAAADLTRLRQDDEDHGDEHVRGVKQVVVRAQRQDEEGQDAPPLQEPHHRPDGQRGGEVRMAEGDAVQRLPGQADAHGEGEGEGQRACGGTAGPAPDAIRAGQRRRDRDEIQDEERGRDPLRTRQHRGQDAIEDRREALRGRDHHVARVQGRIDEPLQDRHGDPMIAVAEAIARRAGQDGAGQGGQQRQARPL